MRVKGATCPRCGETEDIFETYGYSQGDVEANGAGLMFMHHITGEILECVNCYRRSIKQRSETRSVDQP